MLSEALQMRRFHEYWHSLPLSAELLLTVSTEIVILLISYKLYLQYGSINSHAAMVYAHDGAF